MGGREGGREGGILSYSSNNILLLTKSSEFSINKIMPGVADKEYVALVSEQPWVIVVAAAYTHPYNPYTPLTNMASVKLLLWPRQAHKHSLCCPRCEHLLCISCLLTMATVHLSIVRLL